MFIEALINEAGIESCDSTVSFKNDLQIGMNFFKVMIMLTERYGHNSMLITVICKSSCCLQY